MKAKVIKTGEVVEVVQDFGNFLEVARDPEQSQRLWKPDDLDLDYEYWQSFLREAAKDAMCAILSNSKMVDERSWDYSISVVKTAVAYADELIEQLREEKK